MGGRRRGTQAVSGLNYEPWKEARQAVTRGLIFLHIPDDPTIVYYYVCVPNLDVLDCMCLLSSAHTHHSDT